MSFLSFLFNSLITSLQGFFYVFHLTGFSLFAQLKAISVTNDDRNNNNNNFHTFQDEKVSKTDNFFSGRENCLTSHNRS